jgi:cell division septation protein DedD
MSTDDTDTINSRSTAGGDTAVLPEVASAGSRHAAAAVPAGPGAPEAGRSAVSRRGLLAAAGAAGVAATAATVIGVSAKSSTAQATSTAGGPVAGGPVADGASDTNGAGAATPEDGAIVVHVRDLEAGTLDVFKGTEYRRLRDPKLAAQLAAAARS